MNHGTVYCYEHGCSCSRCRAANAKKQRDYQHSKGRVTWEEHVRRLRKRANAAPHGTESKYDYGCRCKRCKKAAAEARQERRTRAR